MGINEGDTTGYSISLQDTMGNIYPLVMTVT